MRHAVFLSTLSLRRATLRSPRIALRVGFLSTLSLRRATPKPCKLRVKHLFLSTLSLRRATRPQYSFARHFVISIHALLAESDRFTLCHSQYPYLISIHALLAESDYHMPAVQVQLSIFLSTLSLRRATLRFAIVNTPILFLSTLSLRRATASGKIRICRSRNFYPRSPCGERRYAQVTATGVAEFLSTLSLRRATAKVHKTVGHFCAYETNFMGIASSC